MEVSYTAPAKVILSGEHGVVYGKPALVSSIDLRLTCIAHEDNDTKPDELTVFITDIISSYLQKKKIDHVKKEVKLKYKSEIPSKRGLGSSAALSVASAAACIHIFTGNPPSAEIVNNAAYHIEKRFHSNPSGVDVSASSFGGLIYYRKEFEFLKTISALNFKLPKQFEEHLYLIDSGKATESTAVMVAQVGKKYNTDPETTDKLFSKMEKVTKKMTLSIIKEDLNLFSKCIEENEEILEHLGVVSLSAKNLLQDLSSYGRGKVTGAGGVSRGSGYIVFIANNKLELESYLTKHNIAFVAFKQGLEGVKKI